MSINETEIFNKIIEKTDSTLILFFILMMIACVIVFLPLYKLILKSKAEKNEADAIQTEKAIKRETQLLDIIEKNTEVISELKTILNNTSMAFFESYHQLSEISKNIDNKMDKLITIISLIDNNVNHLNKKT